MGERKNSVMLGRTVAAAGWAVAVCAWASALAEPPALPPELIQALDSAELHERETATARIVDGDPAARLTAVERAISDPSLSPEQRERLRSAGLRLFDGTPRAAMGVTIPQTVGEAPVQVTPSAPGFDSMRVLRDGDVVRAADGRAILTDHDLRCIIVSHDPGDEVTLSIVRSGEPMTVKVRLGRFSDLGRGSMIEDRIIVGAWDRRVERLMPAPEAPLNGNAGPERWAAALDRARDTRTQRSEPMTDPSSQEPVRSPLFRPPTSTLSLGGQARDPAGRAEGVATGGRSGAVPMDPAAARMARERSEARQLRELQASFTVQIGVFEDQLTQAGLSAEQKDMIRTRLETLKNQQKLIDERVNEMRRLGR